MYVTLIGMKYAFCSLIFLTFSNAASAEMYVARLKPPVARAVEIKGDFLFDDANGTAYLKNGVTTASLPVEEVERAKKQIGFRFVFPAKIFKIEVAAAKPPAE